MEILKKAKRQNGKRKNPAYQQLTAYVPKETFRQMKVALLREDQEISELIQELIEAWLDSKRPTPEQKRRAAVVQQTMVEIRGLLAGPAQNDMRERTALLALLSIQSMQEVASILEYLPNPTGGGAKVRPPSASAPPASSGQKS